MKSILALFVTAGLLPGVGADEIRPSEQIWFDEPATMWEEALPVGSGTLGVDGVRGRGEGAVFIQ